MTDIDLIYFRHNVNLAAPEISAMPISFHDLTIVLDGSLEYVIDGERVIINKGDLIFIKKGSVRFREQGKQPSNYISFNFNSNRKINIPLVFKDGVNNIARILIVAYDEITSTPAFDCREKIKYLLSCLILAFEDNKKAQKFSPLTVKIMEYINCNFSNKITISDIGEQMFFSPVYCDTVFKKETGTSIIEYTIKQRMELSKALLTEGQLPLSEVCQMVGYSDYNYFSRLFKSRTGYSPNSYRKMMQKSLAL